MTGRPCPYRLLRPLRVAGAIEVHEAAADGLSVIVKCANPQRAGADAIGMSRLRREITLAATLKHPGLAAMIDHGEDWIAFERLGASLIEPGCRRLFSAPAAIRLLLARLAETLAYIHARGVVHRDIKPGHVMMRGDLPVLIDLGVAGLLSGDELDGEIVGSPAWMAPEQSFGAPPHPSADIWSLCAVGAWLSGGRPPLEEGADDLLDARRAGRSPVFDLAGCEAADPELASLLRAGLGAPESRPDAVRVAELSRLR